MSYTTPTPAQFKARFPEFGTVPDALIEAIIDEQEPQFGETWIERDRAPALMYLVAHLLTTQGYPADTAGDASGNVTRGPMKRRKVGDVEVEYAGRAGTAGGGTGNGYDTTSYGLMYLSYFRRNFAGARVV